MLKVEKRLRQVASNIILALFEPQLESEHTKSSCMLGMPLGSWAKRNQVVASAGPKIRVGPGALFVEKERVVLRKPPHPQVSFVVGRVLFVAKCLFFLQNETVV